MKNVLLLLAFAFVACSIGYRITSPSELQVRKSAADVYFTDVEHHVPFRSSYYDSAMEIRGDSVLLTVQDDLADARLLDSIGGLSSHGAQRVRETLDIKFDLLIKTRSIHR